MTFTAHIDRSAELKMLKGYSPEAVQQILNKAALAGAEAAKRVMHSKAPVGTAQRLSQLYRKMGLRHGALRSSVRVALVGLSGVYVVGPMGRSAVARAFVAHRNPWTLHAAPSAFAASRVASEAVLELYARKT